MSQYLVTTEDGKKYKVTTEDQLSKPESFGKKAYNFAQETVPYIAGGVAGAAGMPAGPEIGIPASGLAYAGAKSGLRGLGKMLGYEKQNSLADESKQTALKDVPAGMAMEEAAPIIEGAMNSQMAKRAGRGVSDLASIMPGVESRSVQNLFKNPKTILPKFLGGPAPLEESGQAIGKFSKELGIPGLEEREGAQVMKTKIPTGMKEGTVKIQDPSRAYDPEVLEKMKSQLSPKRQAELDKAIRDMKTSMGKSTPATDRQVAARVFDEVKGGKMPDLKETVQAIKGTDNRLQMMGKNLTTLEEQNKKLATEFRKKLVSHLSDMAPKLQEARAQYAKGITRADFVSPGFGLVSKDSGGGLSKMGAMRTLGPYALGRMSSNPGFGALLTGMQSPVVLGAGTAGAGALAQALQSQISPYAIQALLETFRRKKKEESGPQQK